MYIIRLVRILHVVPTYVPAWRYGGPIHSVHGLCKALAARGHDVDVATTSVDGPGELPVPLETPVDVDGVKVHYFRSPFLRRLYYAPRMRSFFASNRSRWQLVHTHSTFLWPTTAAARFAVRAGIPFVLSPRGMLVRELIRRRNPALKRAWIHLFEGSNIRNASAIHVTSTAEGEALADLDLHPRAVFEIPNGIDLDDSAPIDRPSGAYALFLGRISWKKGLDRLVAALAQAPGLQVVVAGNDDEGLWPEMERLAHKLAVHERIRRIGYVEGPEKSRLIRECAFLVLPSRSENFGNVVLEAMAAGAPVVVTPEVGLATVIRETDSGIVADGEPGPLAAAMMSLSRDEPRRKAMGFNARQISKRYSWDFLARNMEAEYERLVAARG
jgi:glycosyltransferase involved in cell wall biosynthesis